MKTFLSLFIALVIGIFSSIPVLAHQGRTDGSGGHYDHSTGEYHYHHGYSAHQHKNGVCPYRYDDNTGHSGSGSGGSLKGGYSGGSGGSSSSDSDDPTVYYVLLGVAGVGLLVWFIHKKVQAKKETRSVAPTSDPPPQPIQQSKPVRLVSPNVEPSLPPILSPVVYQPRRDPDSVLTVKDITPPPLKKTSPVTPTIEESSSIPSSVSTLKTQPIPSSMAYQTKYIPHNATNTRPPVQRKTPATNSRAIDPNHYTYAMREVKSSNIHSIGYSNGTLTVRFHSGREYVYFDVSVTVYYSFINARSIGKYYNENIRQKYTGDFVGIKDTETPKTTNPT